MTANANNKGDIRSRDCYDSLDENVRNNAQQTFTRLKQELIPLFEPAFKQIVKINSQYTKTHGMSAQCGNTNVATLDMAARLLITLMLTNHSQISFISGQELDGDYQKFSINDYDGTEDAFKGMIAEVVAQSSESGLLASTLKPSPVIFAGQEIT